MARNFAKVEASHYNWWRALAQYWVIYFILYPFFKIFFRVEVHGRENIPKDKSILVAANHTSNFDPVILALGIKRPVAFMAKKELFEVPVLSQIIDILGAFAVNRKKLEIATIKSAKTVLSSTNWHMGMFPEGTRIKPGKIRTIHKGFGYLAKATGSDILPFGIILKREHCPIFGKLIVKIGKPIPAPATAEEAIEKWTKAISELTGLEYTPEETADNSNIAV
ncbi:MAG: hypothetical protein A2287_04985 [Candidatus Melainabacteria bacterium RIFOXYA12_FULL_32_12]|nr:MAG: hypothetical protein A2255_00285 [Candidatus Melainabacteria bacterium RIFOXYA2_FULL_32_9]OGI29973.1 MAG: hypothetical protein A2287_04985 [Candidatus Melainabacteria bacterium RIFOXYA12_FULL_32_12]